MTETSTTNAPPRGAPGGRRPARRRRRLPPHRVVGLAVFAGLTLLLVARNWWVVHEHRYEDGDFAANSILIDDAKRLDLLVGNYSRVGFSHPGPALLYVQAASEVALRDVVPVARGPFNAHVLGIVLLDAALVGTAAAVVARRAGRPVAGLAVLLGALVVAHWEPGALASTWMPDVYVWPFLLLLVSTASVASGEPRDLPLVALSAGLLAHGHVSFAMYVVAFGAVAAVAAAAGAARGRAPVPRRTLVVTGAVLGLFALPIVVNLAANWPGELDEYLDYAGSSYAGGHTAGDVWRFVTDPWGGGLVMVGGLLGAGLLAAIVRPRAPRAFLLALTGVLVGATALTVVYAVRGVDDLRFDYVIRYYAAVPALALVVAAVALDLLVRRPGTGGIAVGAGAVVAAVALAGAGALGNPYPGAPWVPDAFEAARGQVPAGAPLVLRFDGNHWPEATGLVEQARRRDVAVCVEDPYWAFMFTDALVCDPAELAGGRVVAIRTRPPAEPGAAFSGPGFQLVAAPPG